MDTSTDPPADTESVGNRWPAGAARSPDADDDVLHAEATESAGFHKFQRYTYWSLVGGALSILVLPVVVGPIGYPPDPLGSVSLITVAVAAVATVRLIGHHIPARAGAPQLRRARWWMWTAVGGVATVVLAGIWVAGEDRMLWPFGPAMIASLVIASFPRRWRSTGILVSVVVASGAGAIIDAVLGVQPPAATAATAAFVTGFAMMLTLATIWSWRIVVQLNEAKRTAASLAVANERLRFAADLHDIQGHNLQVIALKSELAHRLLRRDPTTAEREIAEVQELAADALRDTRAVVQGYRRATLDAEITNATAVLDSAGIDTQLDLPSDLPHVDGDIRLSSDGRHLLGLVVREAVTNVLRHSSARWASVALVLDEGAITLAIENDGATRTPIGDEPAGHATHGGLDDLAERLRAIDGSLAWRHEHDRFVVRARLPMTGTP